MAAAPEIRLFTDADDLAREAADLFIWLGGQAVATGQPFRVALSGGSTPRTLYGLLSGEPYAGQLDWQRVEFYFGDERCVSPDHPESNYGMARAALFGPLRIPSNRICRVAGESADPGQAAREYEGLIRTRFGTPAPVWPKFDLVLLGLGDDGHTASLFPETAALDERDRLVVANEAPRGVSKRVTFTAPLINQARVVLFLVSGASKAAATRVVLEDRSQPPRRYPAKLIRPREGRLIWFLDGAAAAELALAKRQIVSHEE